MGGTITYITQSSSDKRKEKLKEKNDIENLRIRKLKVFGEFLRLEINTPLIHSVHYGDKKDFDWNRYVNSNRDVLYRNIDLLNSELVKLILEIDYIAEKCQFTGPEEEDSIFLYNYYEEIVTLVKQEMNGLIQ